MLGMKPTTKRIFDELQKLFDGEVDAFRFSCSFPSVVFDNYDELEKEHKGLGYYLDQVANTICDEAEPGFDPTHMIEELKKVYDKALEIINKGN